MKSVRFHAGAYPNFQKPEAHWRGTERVVKSLADHLDDTGTSTALDISPAGVQTYATSVLVCCEDSRPFTRLGADVRVLWVLHGDPNTEAIGMADRVVFSSEFHQRDVRSRHPNIDPAICTVIGHPVADPVPAKKVPGRALYASAPERGLHHALRIFQGIRAKVPHAELHVTYGVSDFVERYRYQSTSLGIAALEIAELIEQPGVVVLGQVGPAEMAREMAEATLLLYPCDPERPSENYCVAVGEAVRNGTIPLVSTADCLPEVWGALNTTLALPVDDQEWVDAAVYALTSRPVRRKIEKAMTAMAPRLTLESRAREWRRLFDTLLAEQAA